MPEPIPDRSRAQRDLDRLVFFSDAVVAIAITLLVIGLHVPNLPPDATDADLRAALLAMVPQFFSVILSFAVIALWWTTHHRFFASVARLDGRLIVLNLFFLSAIAFLPFPTSLLGQGALPTAVALYAATNAAIGYAIAGMREYADRAGLLAPDIPRDAFRLRTRRSLVAPTVFAASILVAPINPVVAGWSWNLIWILTLVIRHYRGPSAPY